MADKEIALMAHLMRRAGFGATFEELEARAAKGYEATVDELLDPEGQPELEKDLMMRYQPQWVSQAGLEGQQEEWTYRMINTKRPLEEKIALFWHQIFVTGHAKCEYPKQQTIEFDMFRRDGLGKFDNLLQGLAKDPAMMFYLDNCMSHKDAINENWGRELLELFSMGVGMDGEVNYTEDDVKECARAFTGWTVTNSIPRYPYGKYEAKFIYDSNDHDFGEKTFLGETGNWNGEDIINIVAKQAGTARFISRHLYNFFVSDEPQVPAWQNTPPGDPATIKSLEDEYFRTNYDIRSMLRVLFKSDAFKNSRFTKVKSPTETVVGTMRLVGDFSMPKPGMNAMSLNIRYMGQDLMNPPTVEGWHTGREWIDSGTLVERINFTADAVGNTSHPGIQSIIQRLGAQGPTITAEQLVDGCLDMLGAYVLADVTRNELLALAKADGDLRTGTPEFETRVGQMLQSIVATTEYLFA
ncbi:MAG TPA: hypothetical protein DCL97_03735 [Dehalococcoidia bacterium]|jgi:uncharacterized protein (DUF1800 family)|nr:hypothetical protein [Dehalococcoidia bacterium]|tara:strand:- start:25 stop:1431 length:1407 start_codon:yes stop_codon:yes gene_type:complete